MTPGQLRVLLLEDHAPLREVLRDLLLDEGHAVQLCPTPIDVLASARGRHDCLALVDHWGRSFATLADEERQEIRRLARAVPTVMLTGRPWAEHVRADDLGLLELATKPLDLGELRAMVWRASARTRVPGRRPS
jgi:DNA-binding response OmpR family regulator